MTVAMKLKRTSTRCLEINNRETYSKLEWLAGCYEGLLRKMRHLNGGLQVGWGLPGEAGGRGKRIPRKGSTGETRGSLKKERRSV